MHEPTNSRPRIRPRLEQEWSRLRHRPTAVTRARSWHVTEDDFDDLDGLLRLAGFGVPSTTATSEVFHRLVETGRHDDLAARVALQRLLPGLLAVVRRRAADSDGPDGLLEEIVGAAWIMIRCYDLDRRPACLAAALVWGADHRAFRTGTQLRARRERRAGASIMDRMLDVWPDRSTAATPHDELAEVLADARSAGVDEDDLWLVQRLVETGSTEAVAAELGVTARTIRNRRDRVTYRLRTIALAA